MIYREAKRKETVITICYSGAQKAAPAEQYVMFQNIQGNRFTRGSGRRNKKGTNKGI
jgi:hypothetical protein